MAIVIEEEKKKSALIPVLIWGTIVAVVVTAVYFFFFNQPELIPLPTPPSLENTNALANIKFNPEEVTQNSAFQALKPYISISSSSVTYGRQDPFLPY